MGYGCYIKGGVIYTDPKNNGKMTEILEELGISTDNPEPGNFEVYGAEYCNYHEEIYQPIADIAKHGSLLQFIGDDDSVWTLYLENGKIQDQNGEIVYDSRELNNIAIPLGDGYSIVAEKNFDTDYREVFIYLRKDDDKCIVQDLAIVSENYTYDSQNGSVVPIHGSYNVKVYADPDQEDYTNEFRFGRYEQE